MYKVLAVGSDRNWLALKISKQNMCWTDGGLKTRRRTHRRPADGGRERLLFFGVVGSNPVVAISTLTHPPPAFSIPLDRGEGERAEFRSVDGLVSKNELLTTKRSFHTSTAEAHFGRELDRVLRIFRNEVLRCAFLLYNDPVMINLS